MTVYQRLFKNLSGLLYVSFCPQMTRVLLSVLLYGRRINMVFIRIYLRTEAKSAGLLLIKIIFKRCSLKKKFFEMHHLS